MAPPPSQAGKFKPRKPSPAIVISSGGPTSSRGRRRMPAPQGRAYFTAQPVADAALTSRSREVDEEIVGTLDVAVGATASLLSSPTTKGNTGIRPTDSSFSERAGSPVAASSHHAGSSDASGFLFYDSDSSMEEAVAPSRDGSVPQRPLTLPLFPPAENSAAHLDPAVSQDGRASTAHPNDSHAASPTHREASILPGANEWCLVQLPTRLPVTLPGEKVTMLETAPVATAPIQAAAFDNALLPARAAGRLGRLQVYASGKTVLVTDPGEDGSPPVVLNVSEGLHCEFQQQVVEIHPSEQTYQPLGWVHHAWVLTPDLTAPVP